MLQGIKCVVCKESLFLIFLLYGLIKLVTPLRHDDLLPKKVLFVAIRIVATAIIYPCILLMLIFWALYFEFVQVCAQCYYGARFVDYFKGADAVWSVDSGVAKSIVNVLMMFEDKGPQTPHDMLEFMRDKFQNKVMALHPQMTSLRKPFMGYYFFVQGKTKVDINEVVYYLDNYTTMEDFRLLMDKKSGEELPCGNNFLWEICVGRTKIEYVPGKWAYPTLARFHHSCADGITIISLLVTNLCDDGYQKMKDVFDELLAMLKVKVNTQETQEEKQSEKPLLAKIENELVQVGNRCRQLMNTEMYYHHNVVKHREPKNILHTGQVNVKKIVGMSFEAPEDDFMRKIKCVKHTLKNVAYADVVLGALAASFTEHYVKHDPENMPSSITTANPYFLKAADFDTLVKRRGKDAITNLGNKFTIGYTQLPIKKDFLKNPQEFVYAMSNETKGMKNALDFSLTYWLFNIISTIVPCRVSELVAPCFDNTACITNVPGTNEMEIGNGYRGIDTICWINHWKNIGAGVTIFTFMNRLRVTLNVDADYVQGDVKQAQAITDNFLRYIDKIYKSVCLNETN